MQVQGAQANGQAAKKPGSHLELPAMEQANINASPQPEDLSGLAKDKLELSKIQEGLIPSADGSQVFKTLRVPPEAESKNLPTQETVAALDSNQTLKEIEKIMSERIMEIYSSTPPDRQELLKKEGERIAEEMYQLFSEGKISASDMQTELSHWFSIIPDARKPWVEQEATIVKDRLLSLFNQIQRDHQVN